jgi:hypothetical protein
MFQRNWLHLFCHEGGGIKFHQNVGSYSTALYQACSTSHVVHATLAKFGLHAVNMKFNTQNEE